MDDYDYRFRVLSQSPYTFINVDTFIKQKADGFLPVGISEAMADNASIWQMTVPVVRSDGLYLERWAIVGLYDTKYIDFAYSKTEKRLLEDGLLRIKRENFFKKHKVEGRLHLHRLCLPEDAFNEINRKTRKGIVLTYDCDGGFNDKHPYKGEQKL